MFNLNKFIGDYVTCRPVSMFETDNKANSQKLSSEIKDKKVCVIGGAGSIGSSFIKAVLRFEPKSVVVIDLKENGLAEVVRDVRSTEGLYVPDEFRCYTLNFADPIFERIFREEQGFDIVANFSAHKHVRSEKDKYSVQALIENNDIKAKKLMGLLTFYPPKHFFCVSTDKAVLSPFINIDKINILMQNIMQMYNTQVNPEYLCSMASHYSYFKQCMPKGFYGRPKLMPFCYTQFFGPEKPDEYLKRIYGDYMIIPSADEQKKFYGYFLNANWEE